MDEIITLERITVKGFTVDKEYVECVYYDNKLYCIDDELKEKHALIRYLQALLKDPQKIMDVIKKELADIKEKYGDEFLPEAPNFYKTKVKSAQEAHEAIRPTRPNLIPGVIAAFLTKDQNKLYDLIWRRALACQMKDAIFNQTSADIKAREYIFRATG
ncbi:MAG: DNA topoisomerase, partial [Candidatus Nitrosocaldaceae archaeon]